MGLSQRQLNDLAIIQDQSKWTRFETKECKLQHPFLLLYRMSPYTKTLEYGFMLAGQKEEFQYFVYSGRFLDFVASSNILTDCLCYEYEDLESIIQNNWKVLLKAKLSETTSLALEDIMKKKISHRHN